MFTKINTKLAGICWGTPYHKLRFMVGDKKKGNEQPIEDILYKLQFP
jgi:hypothetical protein